MLFIGVKWNTIIGTIVVGLFLPVVTVSGGMVDSGTSDCFNFNIFSFWMRGQDPRKMCVQELCSMAPYQLTDDQHTLPPIHLAVVACGNRSRMEDTLVMVKSALILSEETIHVHIFADDGLRPQFKEEMNLWPASVLERLDINLHPITYPDGKDAEWRKLFGPCATQRLFFPDILTENDFLLYVDTDVIFLRPIEHMWNFFTHFNSSHIAALAPEHETNSMGWYNRFARHPYYGERGVNSGVMLMKLAKMRELNWVERILGYYSIHHKEIPWTDQDLLNIFFHYFPDKLYVYPCQWNFRTDHCMYGLNCKQVKSCGVSVLHGNRKVYHNEKQPAFKAIYNVFKSFQFGDNLRSGLLLPIQNAVKAEVASGHCGKIGQLFTKQLERQLDLRDQGSRNIANQFEHEDRQLEY